MNREKTVFIINPIAGNGYAETLIPRIENFIQKHKLPGETVLTKAKGHATELSRHYAEMKYKNIFVVGGDGTFNEAIQPLVGKPEVTFGAISAGTGNDFIGILGFNEHFTDRDWEIFAEQNVISMDAGKCNDRYFINGMGLGMDAQVAAENYEYTLSLTDKKTGYVKKGSKAKYQWHILKTLLFYKEQSAQVTLKDTTEERYLFLNSIGMGRRMAGGLFLTPKAYANDGLMDLCLIRKLKIPARLKELTRVKKQLHLDDPVVEYVQTDRVTYVFDREMPSHLDGEMYFNSRFEVEVFPGGLNIVYNPHGEHYFKV